MPRAQRKSEIEHAALVLFAEKGYLATTMEDIGGAVGIRGPSLYKHVASKQEVLVAVIMRTMNNLLAERRRIRDAGGRPESSLWQMVREHAAYAALNPEETFVGTRELHHLDDGNRQAVVQMRSEYADLLQEVIEAGVRSGDFEVKSSRLTTFMVIDMIIGMAVWFRPDSGLSVDELSRQYADTAVDLVRTRA